MKNKVYWTSPIGGFDDFGHPINDIVIDGKTKTGPWALMTPESYKENAYHREVNGDVKFGLGIAQKYQKQSDGKWLKIQG
jgi:hypothetical protein